MKRIILCADDYGQNTAISQAIIELLKKNRLSATSCMTNSCYWSLHAKWVKAFKNQIDIGLHFNLTEGKPLTSEMGSQFGSVSSLILKAFSGRLNQSHIENELLAQIKEFESGIGRLPDFIDGHQHIHQLPIVRNALLNVYDKYLRQSECYIRSVKVPYAFFRFQDYSYLKQMMIQLCGAMGFQSALNKLKIPHNLSFLGVYDFNEAENYSQYFLHFLKKAKNKTLIMCHPGLNFVTPENDSIASSRFLEYQYFSSDTFMEECIRNKIILGRFNE